MLIFPGLAADGTSVAILRAHCRARGHDVFDQGQGLNTGPQGDVDTWLRRLTARVTQLLAGHTQPATLIGRSLGGLHAREMGKLVTAHVCHSLTERRTLGLQLRSAFYSLCGLVEHVRRTRHLRPLALKVMAPRAGWVRWRRA